MSSLVTYASPWNDDGSGNKKRQPTMRKNSKIRPTIQNIEQPEEYMTFSENFQGLQPSTIDESQTTSNDRTERVNELLNKITSADTTQDGKMGAFSPLEPPTLNVKKDMEDNSLSSQYVPPVPTFPHFNQQPTANSSAAKYAANTANLDKYSSYGKSYDGTPYYAKMGLGQGTGQGESVGGSIGQNDKLMEKINYMIHLLEQQQNEKTDNITEEFILYTFLGVFMIFIVDSFARSGKYTR